MDEYKLIGVGILLGALVVMSVLEYVYPLRTDRSGIFRHERTNMVFAVLTIGSLYPLSIWLMSLATEEVLHFGFFHWFSAPLWIQVPVLVLAIDFWYYWAHRMQHHFMVLWRVHRTHHSDPQVDASTNFRTHILEFTLLLSGKLSVVVLLGINPLMTFIFDIVIGTLGIYYHSNLVISERTDRLVRTLFVSQKWHLSHHSNDEQFTNNNYALLFSFWDRMFGTAHMDVNTREIDLGLAQLRGKRWQTVTGLWKTPFMQVQRADESRAQTLSRP